MHLHNVKDRFNPDRTFPSGGKNDYFTSRLPLDRYKGLPAETHDSKCILRQGNYSICLADSPGRCHLINRLIRCMYSWRGYHTENALISANQNPNHLTLEASLERHIVGTLTLGIDSDSGLLADELYGREIDLFRLKGKKVCELSKLAIDPQHSSKEILASLFNLAYIYGRQIHSSTDLFIEINPRHANFYKRLLGFCQVGKKQVCKRVNAPAILMHLDLDYVDRQINYMAGLHDTGERSLYSYFLPKHEEEGITDRLQQQIEKRATGKRFRESLA